MKKHYLFTNRWKRVGWILFIPSLFFGILILTYDLTPALLNFTRHYPLQEGGIATSPNNAFNEIILATIIIGGILVAFSATKMEDEMISQIRLKILMWAVVVHYCLILISNFIFFDFAFLNAMTVHLFTLLFLFIARFEFEMYKYNKVLNDEE